jgi:hypothetical protein
MEAKIRADPELLIQAAWSETFNLPPNDERLLALTAREAYEQVLQSRAIQKIQTEEAEKAPKPTDVLDPDTPMKPVVKTVTGKEAEEIADVPRFTGDPEWDAVEREETDPFREPFDLERFRTDGG